MDLYDIGAGKSPHCLFTRAISLDLYVCDLESPSLNISALDQLKVVNRRGFEAVNAQSKVKNA